MWAGTTRESVSATCSPASLFALRFGDFNLLISDQLTDESEILFDRAINERVRRSPRSCRTTTTRISSAPTAACCGCGTRIRATDRYPNAQPQPAGGGLPGANYIRNSVKVVVDAYDGTVRFFLADPDDPIAAAYARIFPDLFEPMDAMPDELRGAPSLPGGPVPGAERGLPPLPPARQR